MVTLSTETRRTRQRYQQTEDQRVKFMYMAGYVSWKRAEEEEQFKMIINLKKKKSKKKGLLGVQGELNRGPA